MSDEIVKLLTEVRTDVRWIKQGMERGSKRMDAHDKAIASLKNRQHWYSGVAAGVGALLGFFGHRI